MSIKLLEVISRFNYVGWKAGRLSYWNSFLYHTANQTEIPTPSLSAWTVMVVNSTCAAVGLSGLSRLFFVVSVQTLESLHGTNASIDLQFAYSGGFEHRIQNTTIIVETFKATSNHYVWTFGGLGLLSTCDGSALLVQIHPHTHSSPLTSLAESFFI